MRHVQAGQRSQRSAIRKLDTQAHQIMFPLCTHSATPTTDPLEGCGQTLLDALFHFQTKVIDIPYYAFSGKQTRFFLLMYKIKEEIQHANLDPCSLTCGKGPLAYSHLAKSPGNRTSYRWAVPRPCYTGFGLLLASPQEYCIVRKSYKP